MVVDSTSWQRRIDRADRLASENPPAASLLRFYAGLLRRQKKMFDGFGGSPPSGSLEVDVHTVLAIGADLLRWVAATGPADLAPEAAALLDGSDAVRMETVLGYWHRRSDRAFFPKALLQPYAEWLAQTRPGPLIAAPHTVGSRCPRCGGAPQLSVLAGAGGFDDGSSRSLLCATCLTTWVFRRVVCASCGNEDERTLLYYASATWPHVRVDACQTCNRYLKSIDVGRLGLAVPLVDEVAAAPLDIWAVEHGYKKIELNLVGL